MVGLVRIEKKMGKQEKGKRGNTTDRKENKKKKEEGETEND